MFRQLTTAALVLCVLAPATQGWAFGDIACPTKSADTAELEGIRDQLIAATRSESLEYFTRCFSESPAPACFAPVRDAAQQALAISTSFDAKIGDEPKRQPPRELLDDFKESEFSFTLRADAEAIAQKKGWPTVRYKSRHSGGFDRETPSLLMIRIPGSSLKPPVNYDRYLNIALPADQGDDAMNPTPQAPFPSDDDYKQERELRKVMPRVFTIVSLEKPEAGQKPKVYFQMFKRRGRAGDARFSPEPNQNVRECASCHPNGLRAISPLGYHVRAGERQLDPAEWLKVEEMNLAMERDEKTGERFGAPDWRGATVSGSIAQKFLNPAGAGPIYGPFEPLSKETTVNSSGNTVTIRPSRTKNFIVGADGQSGCAYQRTTWNMTDIFNRPPGRGNIYNITREKPVRWQKIRDAMKCSECHDGEARGGFNSLTAFDQVAYKILVDQSMPQQAHKDPMEQVDPVTKAHDPTKPVKDELTGDERIALVNCLLAEYQQLERAQGDAFLKRKSCDR